MILAYDGIVPEVDPEAFVAEGAAVIGDVRIGPRASIWYGCVLRGDVHEIRVGADTNLQDLSVVHVTQGRFGTYIGAGIVIGHRVILHACTLEDRCFIGMGATVMDGAVVETGAMVAAGALVTPGKVVKAGQLWAGAPARPIRDITPEEHATWPELVQHYVDLARKHRETARPVATEG